MRKTTLRKEVIGEMSRPNNFVKVWSPKTPKGNACNSVCT